VAPSITSLFYFSTSPAVKWIAKKYLYINVRKMNLKKELQELEAQYKKIIYRITD